MSQFGAGAADTPVILSSFGLRPYERHGMFYADRDFA
jgi:hypothetical protein